MFVKKNIILNIVCLLYFKKCVQLIFIVGVLQVQVLKITGIN